MSETFDYDDFDDDPQDEDEHDDAADCGRWDNGRLMIQCRLAGSEWCDWDCPIGLYRAERITAMKRRKPTP